MLPGYSRVPSILRHRLRLIWAALTLGLAVICLTSTSVADAGTTPCGASPTDCGLFRCDAGACRTDCQDDDDCVTGAICSAGTCTLRSKPYCFNEFVSVAPNGIGTGCAPHLCDMAAGSCAVTCRVDQDCVPGARCTGEKCFDPRGVRQVDLFDPGNCSCRTPGRGGSAPGGALVLVLLTLAPLRRLRRARSNPRARGRSDLLSPGLLLLGALLACGSPWEELPADEVCKDVGFSIASRTETCTEDAELASRRWDSYETDYRCAVTRVDDRIRTHYVCPVELLRLDCETFNAFGDDLDALLSSIPECTEVVKRKDGSSLSPATDGGDAGSEDANDPADSGTEGG